MKNKANIPPIVVPDVAASGAASPAQVAVPAALSSNSDQNTIALPTSVPPVLPESAALPENAGAEITPSTTLITSDTGSSEVAEVTAVADGFSAVPGTVVLSSTAPTEVAAVTAVAGADLVVDAEDELIFLSEEAVAIEIAKLGNGPAPLLNKMEMQTQTGNGKRLYFWFRGQLFRDDADVWYFFNGQKWKAAKPRMLYLLFQKMAQKMMEVEVPYRLQLLKELVSSTGAPAAVPDAAAGGKDPNEGVYYPSYTFAKALLEPSTANTALQAASYLMTKTVKLDGNLELMNLVNGTINLKTGTFLKHNKNDYLSKMINIKYDPHAVCSVFDRVVSEYFAGDPEEIRFFQKVLGYIISGRNDLKLLFVFLGVQGGEGKSLIGALLRHIFLEYSATMAIGALVSPAT
ncbi:MAG: hypothetical protein JZU65_17430 [Chlorobium sp.]|nr:hypothetical protein [Chlorobium sp.]